MERQIPNAKQNVGRATYAAECKSGKRKDGRGKELRRSCRHIQMERLGSCIALCAIYRVFSAWLSTKRFSI
jgi:hypothetical protein